MIRAELVNELLRAKSRMSVPKGSFWSILRRPSGIEDMIRFYRFVKSTDKIILIDVGANTGYWAETFLKFFPFTEVYAFEPTSRCFQELQQRFAGNSKVRLYHLGLSNHVGVMEINLTQDPACSSFHKYRGEVKTRYREAVKIIGSEKVHVNMLDKMDIDLDGTEQVKIVKIDVQGHEIEVLEGMTRSLNQVDILLLETSFIREYNGVLPSFSVAVETLRRVGLYPIILKDFGIQYGHYATQRDVFFVREKFLDSVLAW